MLLARTFIAPKLGEALDDCQDSASPALVANEVNVPAPMAVADGTTTSFFARRWSATLTRRFQEDPDRAFSCWEDWLKDAQTDWETQMTSVVVSEKPGFFVVNGFRAKRPGAATFIGLQLLPKTHGGWPWRAKIVGDSCLFHLSKSPGIRSIPMETSGEFGSVVKTVESWPKELPHKPANYASRPDGNEALFVEGDVLILATDALSKWLLLREEAGKAVWGSLLELRTQEEFERLVADARNEPDGALENDDVTLIVLAFGEPWARYPTMRFEAAISAAPATRRPPAEPGWKVEPMATGKSMEGGSEMPGVDHEKMRPGPSVVAPEAPGSRDHSDLKTFSRNAGMKRWMAGVGVLMVAVALVAGWEKAYRWQAAYGAEVERSEILRKRVEFHEQTRRRETAEFESTIESLQERHQQQVRAVNHQLAIVVGERDVFSKKAGDEAERRRELEESLQSNVREVNRLLSANEDLKRDNQTLRASATPSVTIPVTAVPPAERAAQ